MIQQKELDYIAEQIKDGFQSGSMRDEKRIIEWFVQITEEQRIEVGEKLK